MNKYCIFQMVRTKKGEKYLYCKYKRAKIERNNCSCCIYREKKNIQKNAIKMQNKPTYKLKTKTPLKSVGKKRITVDHKIYDEVMQRDNNCCRLCSCNTVQLHHIIYRSESKELINEPTNCIMLCVKCHQLVHSNKKKYQPILKDIIKRIS